MEKYRLLYNRAFIATPEFEYNGRVVVGAAVGILFRFFKNGKEVLFEEGDECDVCDNAVCSLDKESDNCCVLSLKPYLVESWFDRMTFEIVEWELVVLQGYACDVVPDCPEEFGYYLVSEGLRVSQDEFARVLREHWESFDVSDNLEAENLSIDYVEV